MSPPRFLLLYCDGVYIVVAYTSTTQMQEKHNGKLVSSTTAVGIGLSLHLKERNERWACMHTYLNKVLLRVLIIIIVLVFFLYYRSSMVIMNELTNHSS